MAKIVVIGAGFAAHTTALYVGNKLGRQHEVTVISNRDVFGYVPSWVWVGVGHMKPEKTVFKLKPVYDHKKYQNEYGRDLFISRLEMGLSCAWMKFMLRYTFIWKFKGLLGWKLIPE